MDNTLYINNVFEVKSVTYINFVLTNGIDTMSDACSVNVFPIYSVLAHCTATVNISD